MLTRRGFLVSGAAGVASAGVVLPAFAERVLRHVRRTGLPLLEPPREPAETVLTLTEGEADDPYWVLHLGDPEALPPRMMWREYLARRGEDLGAGLPQVLAEYELESVSRLDDLAPEWMVEEDWWLTWCSNARAYQLLSGLPLALGACGSGTAGEIDFVDCPTIASSYRAVHVYDAAGLSLLQWRLNELGERVRVEARGEFLLRRRE